MKAALWHWRLSIKSIISKDFEQRISAYISEHLLELANDWLDNDDQDPITADVFAKRITMGELAFRNDGTIEVYYDDDDIFWGHCIIANIDADGNPVSAGYCRIMN